MSVRCRKELPTPFSSQHHAFFTDKLNFIIDLLIEPLLRQEIVRLYADAEATMGEARLVGETGPDVAGKNLSPTTVKVGLSNNLWFATIRFAIHFQSNLSLIFACLYHWFEYRNLLRSTCTIH